MNQFANNLKVQIARDGAAAAPARPVAGPAQPAPSASPDVPPVVTPPPMAKPISGFSLMAKVLWASILKLFGRSPS
jgi:hypothetical protein